MTPSHTKLDLNWDNILSSFSDLDHSNWKNIYLKETKHNRVHNTLGIEPIYFERYASSPLSIPPKIKIVQVFYLRSKNDVELCIEAAANGADLVRLHIDPKDVHILSEFVNKLQNMGHANYLNVSFEIFNPTQRFTEFISSNLPSFLKRISYSWDDSSLSTSIDGLITLSEHSADALSVIVRHVFQTRKLLNYGYKLVRWIIPGDNRFFLSCAIYRAARRVISHYFVNESCLIAGKTVLLDNEEWTSNLITGTLQAASMILGGCDEVEVVPVNPSADAFRWARNTCLILMHESDLNYVNDPSFGSPIVEKLTDMVFNEICEKVDDLFKYEC